MSGIRAEGPKGAGAQELFRSEQKQMVETVKSQPPEGQTTLAQTPREPLASEGPCWKTCGLTLVVSTWATRESHSREACRKLPTEHFQFLETGSSFLHNGSREV